MSGSLDNNYLYLVMGLLIGLYILLLFNTNIKNFRLTKSGCFVLFYLLYIFIIGLPVAGVLFTAKQVGSSMIQFSPLLIYQYYEAKPTEKNKKFILKCIYVIFLYYLIISYFSYTILGVDARRMASSSEDYGDLAIGGGYSFAYAIALFAVYLFDRLLNRAIRDSREQVLNVIIIILASIVIIKTRSTVTVLAYFTGLLITLLAPASKTGIHNLRQPIVNRLAIIITILLILLLKNSFGSLIVSIGRNISNILGDRLLSLGYLLLRSDIGSYASDRIAIPINSFITFIKQPIFGIAYLHGNGYLKATLFGAGNHCEWIDALTNWGLVGGLPFLYVYFSAVHRIYCCNERTLGIGLWVTFIILGLFNPFRSIQTAMVVFFVIPLYRDLHNIKGNG
jgi:multisubunit Na+/H+ antiporter MnhG subunit